MRNRNRTRIWRRIRRPAGVLGLAALALQLAPFASGTCPAMAAEEHAGPSDHQVHAPDHRIATHEAARSSGTDAEAHPAPHHRSDGADPHSPSSPHCDFLAHCATAMPALQPLPSAQVPLVALATPAALPWQLHTAWPQSLTPPPRA